MKVEMTVNNIDVVAQALEEQVNQVLEGIGILAQEYAADGAPVDTGRLKGSMTHELGEKCVYVGTNVEYAPYVEFMDAYHHNTGHAHFLRDAVTKHSDEYKRIAEEWLSQ